MSTGNDLHPVEVHVDGKPLRPWFGWAAEYPEDAEPEVLHQLRTLTVLPLPPASRRADLLEQEATLRSFYLQPQAGEA